MACGADEFKRFQEIDKFFSSGKKATVKELAKYFYNKLRMVNSLLETIKDTPIYEEAESLCKNITKEAPLFDKYGKEVKSESKAAASRVIFLGAPASVVRDSIWSEIYKAMEGNYYISIKYVTPGHTEPENNLLAFLKLELQVPRNPGSK